MGSYVKSIGPAGLIEDRLDAWECRRPGGIGGIDPGSAAVPVTIKRVWCFGKLLGWDYCNDFLVRGDLALGADMPRKDRRRCWTL